MSGLRSRLEAAPLWTPLASVLLAGAWLIPNTSPPWIAFHKDFWAAVVLTLVGLVVVVRQSRARRPLAVDAVAGVLALLAVLCIAQWAAGKTYFFGHAALGLGYFLGAACMLALARAWEAEQPLAVGDFLFPAFLVGALGTAALVYKQWLRLDGLDVWTLPMVAGQRPFGNMLQPNNAATLLLVGLVGLVWLAARRAIGSVVAAFAGLPLVFALVLTQSRTNYLSFSLLVALGIVLAPRVLPRGLRWSLVAWLVAFAVLLFALPTLSAWAGHEVSLVVRSQQELRWGVWKGFGAAALHQPLVGLGFFPGFEPQVVAAEAGYPLPGLFMWSHNAFLDVAVWFGIPAALLLLAVALDALRRLFRVHLTTDVALYAAALLAIGIHAMLELPLAYAYFLLPFAMLVGALAARIALPAVALDARAAAVLVALLGGLLVVVGRDYLRVEQSFYTWRFKISRVGFTHPLDLPETLLLNQFRAYITGVRLPPSALDPGTLRDFAEAARLEPSPLALQAVVQARIEAGDLPGARRYVEIARRITEGAQRKALAASWASMAARDARYAQVQWPE